MNLLAIPTPNIATIDFSRACAVTHILTSVMHKISYFDIETKGHLVHKNLNKGKNYFMTLLNNICIIAATCYNNYNKRSDISLIKR